MSSTWKHVLTLVISILVAAGAYALTNDIDQAIKAGIATAILVFIWHDGKIERVEFPLAIIAGWLFVGAPTPEFLLDYKLEIFLIVLLGAAMWAFHTKHRKTAAILLIAFLVFGRLEALLIGLVLLAALLTIAFVMLELRVKPKRQHGLESEPNGEKRWLRWSFFITIRGVQVKRYVIYTSKLAYNVEETEEEIAPVTATPAAPAAPATAPAATATTT